MRAFSDCHPAAVAVCLLCAALPPMVSMNPVLLLTALTGGLLLLLVRRGATGAFLLSSAGLFLLLAMINPIFSHKGETVLLVINDRPITAEAILYGFAASASVLSALFLFRSFTQIMTSDRLLCLTGMLSPKTALLLSSALRFVPLFSAQAGRVRAARRGMGLARPDSPAARFRENTAVLSTMVTWSLENGIVTADSMAARGYGVGKRTQAGLFRFRRADGAVILLSLLLTLPTLVGMMSGQLAYSYYPALSGIPLSLPAAAAYLSFGLLSLMPAALELRGIVKWNFLQSRI